MSEISTDSSATPPATFVVLGASGDLTKRLLLPGLGSLLAAQPDRQVQVIGADVSEMKKEDWQDLVSKALQEGGCPAQTSTATAQQAEYRTVDVLQEDQVRALIDATSGPTVLYFALPPKITMKSCEVMAKIGKLPERIRLGLEKPFGTDQKSAAAFNAQLNSFVPEQQIFRVDHFLGTSPVLSLLQLRFANRIFKQLWSAENIASVEIVFDEVLTLEGRVNYYDHTGALVDMLQSHLQLVMAMAAMEEPANLTDSGVRDKIADVLHATQAWGNDPVGSAKRARYMAGKIGDRTVPNYLDEEGVKAENNTETLAQITMEIDTPRWQGVPFTLRSGKAMGANRYQVVVTFKPVDQLPDGMGAADTPAVPDQLTIDLGPVDVGLGLMINGADWRALDQVTLQGEAPEVRLWPYGQVLKGMLDADPTLAVRGDIAEQLWRIVDPVIAAWKANETPMDEYPAGSTGPQGW